VPTTVKLFGQTSVVYDVENINNHARRATHLERLVQPLRLDQCLPQRVESLLNGALAVEEGAVSLFGLLSAGPNPQLPAILARANQVFIVALTLPIHASFVAQRLPSNAPVLLENGVRVDGLSRSVVWQREISHGRLEIKISLYTANRYKTTT
jgi:hypothetical protein